MNEESQDFRLIKAKPRSKKLNSRIDLAAMVSISFLLIIFFMVTKELAKPQAMEFGVPDRGCGGTGNAIICGCPRADRIITLLLDDDNKIISYRGILNYSDEQPKRLNYGKDGIRKELTSMNKKIKQYLFSAYGRNDRGAIVIIKPSKKSNYGNLVDILDEMAITEIPTYAIVNDFTPDEVKLLASK